MFLCNRCSFEELPLPLGENSQSNFISSIEQDETPNEAKPSTAYVHNFKCFDSKGLHIIHINCRSLLPKLELKILALKSNASVFCVRGTWINEYVTDSEIKIPGFNVIRKDRGRNGGGICTSKISFKQNV